MEGLTAGITSDTVLLNSNSFLECHIKWFCRNNTDCLSVRRIGTGLGRGRRQSREDGLRLLRACASAAGAGFPLSLRALPFLGGRVPDGGLLRGPLPLLSPVPVPHLPEVVCSHLTLRSLMLGPNCPRILILDAVARCYSLAMQ